MGPTSHRITFLGILLVTRSLRSLDPCGHQYLLAGDWILAVITSSSSSSDRTAADTDPHDQNEGTFQSGPAEEDSRNGHRFVRT